MFRSKRNTLVKRLWKSRILQNEAASSNETAEELELKSVAQSMLKRLKEKQLDVLVHSVESKGGETTDCVLLPKGDIRLGRRTVAPQVMCCQLWRWPYLGPGGAELKRLPCCASANDPAYMCCNPYHWSLLIKTESPKPNRAWPAIQVPSTGRPPDLEMGDSTETGMTPTSRRDLFTDGTNGCRGPQWCSIAYWELKQRVGRLLPVFDPAINIFQVLPHGDGMCLEILQQETDMESVKRTREKIGFGIILSKEEDGVWVYNHSHFPIFVNSPTLDIPNSRTLTVLKVMPGYSIKIFDYKQAQWIEDIRDPQFLDGPYDPSSVRISFAKGWGHNYSRMFITSCPCWIEVLLNVTNR